MLYADDFREIARHALRGKWGLAIGTGFIASLLGVNVLSGNNLTKRLDSMDIHIISQIRPFIVTSFSILFLLGIISLFLGGAIKLGYCRFNKNLINKTNPEFNDLFSRFDIFWKACGMHLLIILYTLFWTLLFVIPGIIASLSYAMAPYILEENPSMGIQEAIGHSKDMMSGNKWRFFCLNLSFIGWVFLSAFTLGIGLLWLNPYMSAAHAAFYKDVSGKSNMKEEEYYYE